jgi:hypothetical protein
MILRARTCCSMLLTACLIVSFASRAAASPELTAPELERIGRRVWQNECNGSVEGLTSWNIGENFASLGIGHVIWYPAGETGPFEESFPKLSDWFLQNGVQVPKWVRESHGCPWPDRAAFMQDRDSSKMQELRLLLARTVTEQTWFLIHRRDAALPRMQKAAGSASERVTANIQALRLTSAGNFAMIDYVNFKGDGLDPKESYKGEGWGLLQVLVAMEPGDAAAAPRAFADAAKRVLTRRVQNSPPERGEQRWLRGWLNRCERYADSDSGASGRSRKR